MDLEEVLKIADTFLSKKFEPLEKAIELNKEQLNQLSSIVDSLAEQCNKKEHDNRPKTSVPIAKSRSPTRQEALGKQTSRSKIGALKGVEVDKALKKKEDHEAKKPEDTKEGLLKKNESKIGLKRPSDVGSGVKPKVHETNEHQAKDKEKEEKKDVKKGQAKDKEVEEKKDKKGQVKDKEEEEKKDKKGQAKDKEEEEKKDGKKTLKKPTTARVTHKAPAEEAKAKNDAEKPKKTGTDARKNSKKPEEKDEKIETEENLQIEPEEENNDINFTPVIKNYTITELEGLLSGLKPSPPSKSDRNYVASMGVQILLHSLSSIPPAKFYIIKDNPSDELLWVFKVLWVLQGKPVGENESFWKEIKEFITLPSNKNRLVSEIGKKIAELADCFDFSNENLDKVEEIISGVDIDIKKISEKCEVSGIICYLIKEAALFGGLLLPNGTDWRVHERYEHKLSLLKSH